jgi:hypothetical protein
MSRLSMLNRRTLLLFAAAPILWPARAASPGATVLCGERTAPFERTRPDAREWWVRATDLPWTRDQLDGMGLHQLQGTVRYPTQATAGRSPVGCVQENRMHSLKGGYMETGQQ